MKIAIALAGVLAASVSAAQDVSTSFTLGTPTPSCIPVLTQDGFSTGGQGAVCPSSGGASIQISLPHDPINPGNPLNMSGCSVAVVSNTVPGYGTATPAPPGSLVQRVSCAVAYSYFTATWSGTLTYNYNSVKQTHCSSGHPVCKTAYYPVWASGSGTFSTPQPPPPPPPPPQPTVSTLTLTLNSGPCDPRSVCELVPTDPNVVASASIDFSTGTLTVLYTNGDVRTAPGGVGVAPNGDDGTSYTITASGPLYDANGNSNQTVDLGLVTTANDAGQFIQTGGTLTITTTTPPALALTLAAGTCDDSYVCTLNPTDPRVLSSAQYSLFASQLTLQNADGTQAVVDLTSVSFVPNDPTGMSYTVSGSGSTFDQSVDFTLVLTVDFQGNETMAVSSGSINLNPL